MEAKSLQSCQDQEEHEWSSANEHISFGGGIHHRIGASLVRMESQIVLGSLVQRFPRMELAVEPKCGDRRRCAA